MADGELTLRDGRRLAWGELGDPDGFPVLGFHGTPGSRHHLLIDGATYEAAGVRMIAPDRPGYGGSTWEPDRTLVGWADDVAQLADHLRLDRFAVAGISGGGPHALVAAHGLPERVVAAASLSGIAPVGEPGSEAGMMPVNRFFTRVSRRRPRVNAVPFGAMAVLGRRATDRALAALARSATSPDRALLERPDVAAAFRRDLGEASRTTGRAAAQDFGLFARDWGFDLGAIRVPVHLWHSDLDRNVPIDHARRLAAAIPGAHLHLTEGEGHFMSLDHLDEVLAALRAAA